MFMSFTAFFYFMVKDDIENFRDFIRSLENTMAMSIGKFNFTALRSSSELAAWIFFIFSVVVNMILINMMMAIINIAFENIKSNETRFKNRFELVDYVKRTIREVVGVSIAEPIQPVYLDEDDLDDSDKEELAEEEKTEKVSDDFSRKTDALFK